MASSLFPSPKCILTLEVLFSQLPSSMTWLVPIDALVRLVWNDNNIFILVSAQGTEAPVCLWSLKPGQHKQYDGMTHPPFATDVAAVCASLCSHPKNTWYKQLQEPLLHLLAPLHQLPWIPLMCWIMKSSNGRATPLIPNKYKILSHAAHCITVKQIVPD